MITTLGKRGPTPAPTAIRRLHRARPDRINNAEPVPMSWASSAAVVAVARRASHLGRAGPGSAAARVLTPWDAETFSACCDAAARRAVAHLEGEVVEQAVMVIVCTPRSPRPAGRLVGWSAACRCGWRVTRRTPALRDQDVDAHELCSNETNKRNEGNYESVAT